jgi:hypothetical protein
MEHTLVIIFALTVLSAVALVRERLRRHHWGRLAQLPPRPISFSPNENHLKIGLTDIPLPEEFGNAAKREEAVARLSAVINQNLQALFQRERPLGRNHLARVLVEAVEYLSFETLNLAGYETYRLDYDGDINFEKSGQTVMACAEPCKGLTLVFRGFACEVSFWEKQNTTGGGPFHIFTRRACPSTLPRINR